MELKPEDKLLFVCRILDLLEAAFRRVYPDSAPPLEKGYEATFLDLIKKDSEGAEGKGSAPQSQSPSEPETETK